jgi:hypothetical protein
MERRDFVVLARPNSVLGHNSTVHIIEQEWISTAG